MHLDYPNLTNSNTVLLYVGPEAGGGSSISGTAIYGVAHSLIAVVNGTSSILDVDGVQTAGTLSTASFVKPAGLCGDFGGGSCVGYSAGAEVNPNIPSPTQLTSLMVILRQHLGSCTGPC
jgi:hypothetical protein